MNDTNATAQGSSSKVQRANRASSAGKLPPAAAALAFLVCSSSLFAQVTPMAHATSAVQSPAATAPTGPRPTDSDTDSDTKQVLPPGHRTHQTVARGAGVRIYVDRATGDLSAHPTADQRAALRSTIGARGASKTVAGSSQAPAWRLNESGEGLQPFEVPAGVGLHLEGRFQSSLIVRRTADGALEVVCTDDGVRDPQPSVPSTDLPVR